MIKMILKQLWNTRRANVWIFVELVLAGYFMWTVTDSLYFFAGNALTPDGHSVEECYVVDVDNVGIFLPDEVPAEVTPVARRAAYIDIAKAVRALPEIAYYCIADKKSIPGTTAVGMNKGTLSEEPGSDLADLLTFTALPELGDEQPFATYGIKDVETGEVIVLPEGMDRSKDIYISEEYAKALYGTVQVKGKEVVKWGDMYRIAGVYKDFKTHSKYYTPLEHTIINFGKDFQTHAGYYYDLCERYPIIIRLKEGVNRAAFEKRFNEEIAPSLRRGVFRCCGLVPVSELQKQSMKLTGGEGEMNMDIALSFFALGCIFLGMVGCFWIRANARRGEIGLMRSVGASRTRVISQFLGEAAVLVSLAYIVAAPFLIKTAEESVYYTKAQEMGYIVGCYLEKIPHFVMHTGLNFIIILSTALIGTYIAVNRVVEQHPAQALKDE